jgi:AcrR family transcriptional regulator
MFIYKRIRPELQVSPRSRSVENAEILAATGRVIARVGPARLSLALVAKEVGLAPATLVQRFGSKRGLILALSESAAGECTGLVERLRQKHASPLAALREFLLCFADMASTPEEMANHLAFFQMDLVDPSLRQIALEITEENESTVASLLQEALDAREVANCHPRELAPVLLLVAQGSLLSWAIRRKGSARKWLARHLDITLRPYLVRIETT